MSGRPSNGSRSATFARERQQLILSVVDRDGRAIVGDLADRFAVSEQTIRKDLLVLEAEDSLIRTHGGAIATDHRRPELAFDLRRRLNADPKRRIGATAAACVQDGETIALDASTTALEVAKQLRSRPSWEQLTVVTNGIRIAEELAGHDGITILVPAGRLRWQAMSVVGPWGDGFLRRVNVARAFLGAAGFTISAGLTDATEEEAQIKRAMVAAAVEVTAVIDGSKWGHAALATFCRTDRISRVVTDAPADTDLVEALARAGIPLVEAIATEIGPTESDDARLRPGPRGGEDRRPVPGPASSPT
jgi:DeoR/GlpR family transcriptional regulator of sugar metabolism